MRRIHTLAAVVLVPLSVLSCGLLAASLHVDDETPKIVSAVDDSGSMAGYRHLALDASSGVPRMGSPVGVDISSPSAGESIMSWEEDDQRMVSDSASPDREGEDIAQALPGSGEGRWVLYLLGGSLVIVGGGGVSSLLLRREVS